VKLCLVSSSGGHLLELMRIEPAWKKHEHFFVTFRREDVATRLGGERVYYVTDPKRNPLKVIMNMLQAMRILARERPDVVITTGAGVAVPLCYIAKFLGIRVVFIDTLTAVDGLSLAGRAVYPLADLFIVQWPELAKKYPRAVLGSVL
jgi:UDP-N-acetylglucosamine:LPS N-acetylglucosamine transferase